MINFLLSLSPSFCPNFFFSPSPNPNPADPAHGPGETFEGKELEKIYNHYIPYLSIFPIAFFLNIY